MSCIFIKKFFRDERRNELSFGDWLKLTREKSGLSQTTLVESAKLIAGRVVCSNGYVSSLERNYDINKSKSGRATRPDIFIVDSLAMALADALHRPRQEVIAEARVAAEYAKPDELAEPPLYDVSLSDINFKFGQLPEEYKEKYREFLEILNERLTRDLDDLKASSEQ
jgi:transcriptional regulator with XRE-family HTH domain